VVGLGTILGVVVAPDEIEAGVVAGLAPPVAAIDVAEASWPDDELPTWTAGPTSSCFPANGSVLSPQLPPALLNVLPYIRHML
jgi:hypothetical protein